jgi:hypothetical protein
MLVALSLLAAEQCNPTERTMEKCKQFLDYAATQEDAIITYHKSDMVLAIHSDASYLSEPRARSRATLHLSGAMFSYRTNTSPTLHKHNLILIHRFSFFALTPSL